MVITTPDIYDIVPNLPFYPFLAQDGKGYGRRAVGFPGCGWEVEACGWGLDCPLGGG